MLSENQLKQISNYEEIIPTIPEAKIRRRHRMKIKLFREQDGICCLCNQPMMIKHGGSRGYYATFEHVVLRSKGGGFKAENVPLSHGTCNSRRGSIDFQEFKTMIEKNGGVVPYPPNSKKIIFEKARDGDEKGIEHFLAKKLNMALYIFRIEENIIPCPENLNIDSLKEKLEKPIKL